MALISFVIITVISCVICSSPAELHTCVLVANEVKRSVAAGYFHLDLSKFVFPFQKQMVLCAFCCCWNKVISLMASIKYACIDFLLQVLAF